MTEPKPIDTPEMIRYCLNCPWDNCWNCLGLKNCYSYGLRLELGGEWRGRFATSD